MKDEQTHAIIGVAMEVHRELEPGFLEPVYQDALAVELKALPAITGVEEAQLINYLKARKLERGLLINFARPSLEFMRYIFSNLRKSAQSADSPRSSVVEYE